MQRKKIISLGLILIGVVLIGYPIALKVQTALQAEKLKAQFAVTRSDGNPEQMPNRQSGVDSTPKGDEPAATVNTGGKKVIFELKINKISLDVPVVEITDLSEFDNITQIPAHYPKSGLPGKPGNTAIAGHVNGPAGYFGKLHLLKQGDTIELDTPQLTYNYQVERVFVAEKNDWSVVANTSDEVLTLTTCSRVGSDTSAQRLIVRAKRI